MILRVLVWLKMSVSYYLEKSISPFWYQLVQLTNSLPLVLEQSSTNGLPDTWSTLEAVLIFTFLPFWIISLFIWWFFFRNPKASGTERSTNSEGSPDNDPSSQSMGKDLTVDQIKLQSLLDSMLDGVITIDEKGTILAFNLAAERIFGYGSGEVIGQNINGLMPEPYASQHDDYLKNYKNTGKAQIIGIGRKVKGLRKDGGIFPIHLGVSEIIEGGRRLYVGLIRDLSEIQEALNKQEYLASIIEGTRDAVISMDLEGVITSWNLSAEKMYGYTVAEMIGQSITTMISHANEKETTDILRKLHKGQSIEPYETQHMCKDGSTVYVSLTISPILDDAGCVIGASMIARDITTKKTAEQTLENERQAKEELSKRYQSILNAAGDGIYGLDLKGITTFCNPAGARMLGYTVEELVGKSQHQLIHHTRPDGTPYPQRECPIYFALKDGKVHYASNEVFWRKDEAPLPVEYFSTPIMENGTITGAVVTFRDISRRIKAEREIEESRLAEKTANRAKGVFLANMSHEIRTPMNAILGYAQLLALDPNLNDDQRDNIKKILTGGDHLLALINDILDFSKIEAGRMELNPVDFDLKQFIDRLSPLVQGRCHQKNLSWSIEGIPDEQTHVYADETKLRQILLNLLGNAVKFTREGGVILKIIVLPEGNYTFEVIDSGIGIPESSIEKIFEVFDRGSFTVEEGGTGLGLAISLNLVKIMGGTLSVKSTPGKGSCFSFTLKLPPSDERIIEEPVGSREIIGLAPGYNLCAVVVDDIKENREVLTQILERIGAEVFCGNNGYEGIELVERYVPQIVFMDLRMPNMGGVEAIRSIREKFNSQQMKIIVVTASVFEHQAQEAFNAGGDGFISKPFQINQIYDALDEFLQLEFVYSQNPREPKKDMGLEGLDLSEIKLELGLFSRLKNAADLYSITDLAQALDELASLGGDEKQLAQYLRNLGKSFDMIEISKILDKITPSK